LWREEGIMKNTQVSKQSLLMAAVLCLGFSQQLSATVNFHNRSSMIAIKSTNSLLRVNTASAITGWSEESIVKEFGNNAATSWIGTYTDGIVVSRAGGGAHTNLVYSNSNALRNIRNNSNALLRLTRNNSNALLRLTRNNSNAILVCCKNLSNALLRLTTNNSNAIIANGPGGASLAAATSNALLYLTKNLSNSIIVLDRKERTDSNALLYLTKNLSNALLACCNNNSNAILVLNSKERTDSNALLYLTKNLSNALLACCNNNSNALLYLTKNLSNSIIVLDSKERTDSNALLYLTKNLSNALLACCNNNSNALLYLTNNLSNSIIVLDRKERTDSNAMLQLTTNNSNALLSCCKNNSNTLLRLTTNNSQAIILLFAGTGNLIIPGPTYTLQKNFVVSVDSTVSVTGHTVLDGNGHAFDFARQAGNFNISAGKNLILTDVVLKNFTDGSITLGAGASVVFGEGTIIELPDMQTLTSNMTFSGTTLIEGFGNKIMMGNSVITVRPGGRLTMQDIFVEGLKQNNIRCQGTSASLKLKNAVLCLSNDYSFTSGRILFEMDVRMVGTNVFGYRPTNASSKILPCSRLMMDIGTTFSYAPVSANRDLLGMADRSSVFFLNGCTVQSTVTGMRLTNGTLVVDHKNQFYNTGALSASEAIAFGNGTAANDLAVEILPGGKIQLQSGELVYANAS
jgi:hypothetical protein